MIFQGRTISRKQLHFNEITLPQLRKGTDTKIQQCDALLDFRVNREVNNISITGGDSGAVLTPSPSTGLQRREDWEISSQER